MDDRNYSEEEIKRESGGKLFVIVIVSIIFIVAVIGISVATFTYTKEKDSINTISTGNVYMNYTENTNGINITNAYPINDEVGKTLTDTNYYFDFSIKAEISGNVVANYEIAAEKDISSTLSNDEDKLYLEKMIDNSYEEVMEPKHFGPLKESTDIGTEAGSMLLYSDSFSKSDTVNYRLRMWVADDAILDNTQKTFAVRVSIKAKIDLS